MSEGQEPEQTVDAFASTRDELMSPLGETQDVGRDATHAPPERQGAPIGNYRVLEELGRGGMGVVYLAQHQDGTKVALKLLLNESQATYTQRSRFVREAEAASRLEHPGIVRVVESGAHEGKPFIAMEFVEGPALSDVLDRLKLEDVVGLLAKICRALGHAHARDIVHRDLKPANIMIREADGQPIVMDFGLARPLDEDSLTQTGLVMGTPHYLAPEQADDSKRVTPASDVYALGTILYKGLVGRTPFAHVHQVLKLLRAIMEDEPRPPSEHNHRVPDVLEEICLKALAKDPRQRYPNGDAMAEALEHAYAQLWGGEPVFETIPELERNKQTRIVPPTETSDLGDVSDMGDVPAGSGTLEIMRTGLFGTVGIGTLCVSLCCLLSGGWCLSGDSAVDSRLADYVAGAELLSPQEAAKATGRVCVERQVAGIGSALDVKGKRALHVQRSTTKKDPPGTPNRDRQMYLAVQDPPQTVESFNLGPLEVRPARARFWSLDNWDDRSDPAQDVNYYYLPADVPLTVIGEARDGVLSAEYGELVLVSRIGKDEFEEDLRSTGLVGFMAYTSLAGGVGLLLVGLISLLLARRRKPQVVAA